MKFYLNLKSSICYRAQYVEFLAALWVPTLAPSLFSLNLFYSLWYINHFTVMKCLDILSFQVCVWRKNWWLWWHQVYDCITCFSHYYYLNNLPVSSFVTKHSLCFYSVSCSLNSLCCFMQIIKYLDWTQDKMAQSRLEKIGTIYSRVTGGLVGFNIWFLFILNCQVYIKVEQ